MSLEGLGAQLVIQKWKADQVADGNGSVLGAANCLMKMEEPRISTLAMVEVSLQVVLAVGPERAHPLEAECVVKATLIWGRVYASHQNSAPVTAEPCGIRNGQAANPTLIPVTDSPMSITQIRMVNM